MYLTENQAYLLSVLDETRYLRCAQAYLLLRLKEPWKTPEQADAAMRQLRYLGRAVFLDGGNVIALPEYREKTPDAGMLDAVDVMLDLAGKELLRISARKPPFKLCFLAAQPDGGIGSFAVMPVERGREAVVSAQVQLEEADRRTVVFLLSDWSQHEAVHTGLPHYFMLRDNGKRRYFKGVVAGK